MPASISGMIINELQLGSSFAPGGIDANNDGTATAADASVELYNDGSFSVFLTGWELWYANNDVTAAQLFATINPTIVPPGGYYTVVSNFPTFNDTSNVGAGQEGDILLNENNASTYALYDPNSNQYILLTGASSNGNSAALVVDAILSAHPVAALAGPQEFYPVRSGTDPASVQRVTDGSDTWEVNSSTLGAANCFAEGTLIATPDQEVAVETLAIGDLVRTLDGRNVSVHWVGRQTIKRRFWGPRAQLVRIASGSLRNHSDLFVTGDHGLMLDGRLVNASALVNGTTIDWVPLDQTPELQTVYHVETEGHEVIFANGAPSESYLDVPGRRAFDNYGEYLELYGLERNIPENPMPRISSARLLPRHLQKLACA